MHPHIYLLSPRGVAYLLHNPYVTRRVSCPTLVGRDTEIGRLDAAFKQIRDGSSALLFLAGDAGIGKSRLAATFAAQARAEDALVFTGGCLDLAEGSTPYAPFVAALRPLADELSGDELSQVLGAASPELGALLPELCGSPPERRERGRLYELALGVFERMAALRPAVLILEDLHWIDPASRDLLAVLGGNLRRAGLLIIGTYRSDEVGRDHPLHGTLLELMRSARAERVELGGLSRDQVTEQVAGILGTRPGDRQAESLYRRSGGNPFFVEELVAAGPSTSSLPATLREVLLTRVDRLGAATRQVLDAVSAVGRVCDDELIASVTGLAAADLDAALHEAVAHRLLIVTDDGYDVRHALLREALDTELLPGERHRRHAAVAAALAEHDGPAAELARHWHAAGDRPRAFAAFVVAAVTARSQYASTHALVHYERALALWPDVPGAAELCGLDHAALLQGAAEMATAEGESARAAVLTETAIGQVDPATDSVRAAELRTLLGRIRSSSGDMAGASRSFAEAIELLPASGSSRARAQVLALQGHAFMLRCRYSSAVQCCRDAIAMASGVGAYDIEGHARNSLGAALTMLGETEAGLVELAEALRIARERDDSWELGRTYVNYSDALMGAGYWAESAEIGFEGIEVCRRLGYGRSMCMCVAGNTLAALIRLGRWDDADRLVEDSLRTDAPPWQRLMITLGMAELDLRRGRLQGARRHLASLEEAAANTDEIEVGSAYHVCGARLAIAEADTEAARAHVHAGLDLVRGTEFTRIGPELCAIGLRIGEPLLDECGAFIAALPPLPEPQAHAHQAAAEAAVTGAREAWRTAADAWEKLGEPYQLAYCRFREAEAVLAARGSRTQAEAALRAARGLTDRLGALILGTQIEDLGRRSRLELTPPAEPLRRLGLTVREGEILALVSSGRTNRQIAETLFISERTVGVHVSRVLRKLDVPNRVAAAQLYRDHTS